ncbi:hypothetical protein EJ02DRAFT_489394 [Clathrospora elynae]|uniref:Uncharacterized protein n=1 Tax=Clathrospora elynae TaxID=706981 RepID=A0A6A5T331_9PLEO|nr:hypothetical protein EJ02DRAFT_489394 [Clathrospora elynae]
MVLHDLLYVCARVNTSSFHSCSRLGPIDNYHHPYHPISPDNMTTNTTQYSEAGTPQTTASMPPSTITMRYEPRGDWTLHRLDSATEFTCGQCNKQKKAKLIAICHGMWDDLCCNACYGQILSKE